MQADTLSKDSNFEVKESVVLDLIIAAIGFAMAGSALLYDSNAYGSALFGKSLLIGLIPGVIFAVKAIKNNATLSINKEGIYLHNNFITDWTFFKTAYVQQMPLAAGGYTDNIVLIIEYYKVGESGFFKRKISLTSTQNKSEEEIIAAITYFYKISKKVSDS